MNPVLLLNASYEPLRVVSAERAVILILQGKAEAVSDSDNVMRSPSTTVKVPLVARLVAMAKVPRMTRVPFSRKMLAHRDGGVCQFSGCERKGTTVDHLLPSSRGGKSPTRTVFSPVVPATSRRPTGRSKRWVGRSRSVLSQSSGRWSFSPVLATRLLSPSGLSGSQHLPDRCPLLEAS
jgi:hypothetical protein